MEYKLCTKCGENLPATTEYFSNHKSHKDGLSSHCKKCKNESARQYKKNNHNRIKEQSKNYYQNNIDKVRAKHRNYQKLCRSTTDGKEILKISKYKCMALNYLNGGSYTLEQWKECLEFFDNRCAYTGEILSPSNVNVEHIIPLSKNGTSFIWNICPSIDYANFSKGNKDIEEWYKEQTYFSEEKLEKIYTWIEYAKFMY